MPPDPTPTPTPTPTPDPTPTPSQPWHNGVDPDTLGWWQNKGYDLTDPVKFAGGITKQYRELEKNIGVPPDRIIRLPEKPDDLAGWNGVYSKLGVPADAKDYDFTGIKRADNTDVPAALADSLRAAMLVARVPKDRGPDVVKAVIKSLDDAAAQEATVLQSKIDAEKVALEKNWGPNKDFNLLKAMEGARRLGISPEAVAAMEKQVGYASVMEAMRKIGVGTSEDTWHDGARGPGGNPTTLEGAKSKLAELESDKAWGARLRAKDAATVAEWRALTGQINAAEAA